MPHLGPGPVFVSESVAAARRRSTYALRSLAVLALLGGLLLIGWEVVAQSERLAAGGSIRALSEIGTVFFITIATIQISLALLAAPAATAGAVCLDRARGTLAHVLVTDLSDGEIVLGKLAARLAPVFALVL